jgi:hypothetical protein
MVQIAPTTSTEHACGYTLVRQFVFAKMQILAPTHVNMHCSGHVFIKLEEKDKGKRKDLWAWQYAEFERCVSRNKA